MPDMYNKIKALYDNFQFDEARHARKKNNDNSDSETPDEEPQLTFPERMARRIENMKTTAEELKQAITKTQLDIKDGSINSTFGQNKIDGWKSRLLTTEYNIQILQTALDAYLENETEDNKRNLRMAAKKTL